MAKLIKTDSSVTDIFPADKEAGFTLEEIYGAIGCELFEPLSLSNGKMLLMDEEGRLKGLAVNEQASVIASVDFGYSCVIVGNAIYCDQSELK